MASRRSQILDAMFNALSASSATDLITQAPYTKPVGLTVWRTRKSEFKASDLPAVVLRRAEEPNKSDAGGYKSRRQFLVAVDCFVGAASEGETLEDALDAVTSWAVQAIYNVQALQGGTGCLALSTRDVFTKWEEADADAVFARASVGFASDYITAAGNPDAA